MNMPSPETLSVQSFQLAHLDTSAVRPIHADIVHPRSLSHRSLWSVLSAWSVLSVASAASLLSVGSFASILSIGSSNSILSIGSEGGFLSIGASRRSRRWRRSTTQDEPVHDVRPATSDAS